MICVIFVVDVFIVILFYFYGIQLVRQLSCLVVILMYIFYYIYMLKV